MVTPEMIEKKKYGVGDEVFITGLFQPSASGITRNMPILRCGNIAMLPEEQLQTEYGYADVYLVEARSIGGVSGSPVFVRETLELGPVEREDGTEVLMSGVGASQCLGLMQGHWDVRESEINSLIVDQDRKRGVNLGIAIVVPAVKIIETINRPELMAIREEVEKRERRRSVPGMDSADKQTAGSEHPFTREEFEAALKKASRKLDEPK
jgi:hypothetical protein